MFEVMKRNALAETRSRETIRRTLNRAQARFSSDVEEDLSALVDGETLGEPAALSECRRRKVARYILIKMTQKELAASHE